MDSESESRIEMSPAEAKKGSKIEIFAKTGKKIWNFFKFFQNFPKCEIFETKLLKILGNCDNQEEFDEKRNLMHNFLTKHYKNFDEKMLYIGTCGHVLKF